MAVRTVESDVVLYERPLPASDTVCCRRRRLLLRCIAHAAQPSLAHAPLLQVVCVALHNTAAVLAHVIQSSDRTVYLCNWERLAEGEQERSLTFLQPVSQVSAPLQRRHSGLFALLNVSFTQVSLLHNVCIVCLPSAVHVVALHTLRILQVT